MPAYVTREETPGRGREWGRGPALPWGLVSPIAVQLGMGALARFNQPDRLALGDNAPTPGADRNELRVFDPRTLDAGRLLDYGAPAPAMLVEYAPVPYRPTEAPSHLQRSVALGGRYVGFLP